MKIITSDAVYVQKNDMGFLNQTDSAIPTSIFMKVFGRGITIIDDTNRFEFIKFEEEHEIDFFKSLDWIVDYDSVKDLNEDEIIQMGYSINDEKNKIAKVFNAMSDEDRRKNLSMVEECEKLDFKMYSLRDILWFKQGHLQMELPEGIEYPIDYKKTEEKGLKRLLSKLKKNFNN